MMEIMAYNLFNVGVQSSESFDDAFDHAIDRITCPIGFQPEPQLGHDDDEPDMKEAFMNAYADEDSDTQKTQDIVTTTPQKYDIICGRDKLSHAHVGNKRFRVVIEMNRERYQTAQSRDDKTRITCEIVAMIQSCRPGGRFLKLDNGAWNDVGDEYAREKVSHALRSAKDPARKKTRKRRKITTKTHSEQENKTFFELLGDQQRIFQQLVQHEEAARPTKRLRRDESSSSVESF